MIGSAEKLKVLCEQYLIEADNDVFLAYSLMRMEYSLIGQPLPVKDLEEFKKYLGVE